MVRPADGRGGAGAGVARRRGRSPSSSATNGRDVPYRVDARRRRRADDRPGPADRRARGIDVAGGRVAIAAASMARRARSGPSRTAALRQVTREGSAWQRRFPARRARGAAARGPAGPIHAWLASPRGAGRKRLPTVLHIHGGPTGAWGPGGTLDEMALCAAGYRVLMPNIRGSATFGGGVGRGPLRAAGATPTPRTPSRRSTASWSAGLADPNRLAVMGLSYGGFLTQWLIGVTDRFARRRSARTAWPTRRRPGRTRTSASTTTAAPASATR